MQMSAEELLGGYTSAAIQTMARVRGISPQLKNKEKLVRRLAETLYNPSRIQQAVAELEPRQRAVLDRLILAGGSLATQVLRAGLEQEHLITPRKRGFSSYSAPSERGSAAARDSEKFEDIIARLGALCLVFSTGQVQYGRMQDLATPGRRLLIPEEILRHLPAVTIEPVIGEPPPAVAEGNAAALQRDLYTLLSFAQRQTIPLTMRGQIVKRALVKLDQELSTSEVTTSTRSEDELARVPFLRALAEDLGLLSASVGTLAPNPGIEPYLRRPSGERLKQFYETYRTTGRWNELYRIPNLRVSGKGSSVHTAPAQLAAARQRVLAEIAELPAEHWIPLSHLVDRLHRRAYEFLLPRQVDPQGYYYGYGYGYDTINPYHTENGLGLRFDEIFDETGWNRVEAGMIRVMVAEPLAWLGVLDLGRRGDELVAFRITATGARLLHGQEPPSAEVAPQVVVQPNFQVFAFEPTSEAVLFMLDRLAERVRAEQAIEYELTRESLYRAQQSGLGIAEIIAFLERVSSVGLPQNVRRTLEDWGAQHERITIRRGIGLLHAVDEATLDALYADPELGPLLGRHATAGVALIPVANLQTLYTRLLDAGHLPALSEGDDLAARPVFTIDAEGRVAFRQRLPSIQVLRVLRPIVETDGASVEAAPRLTPDTLRNAARSGLSAEEIIATLERYHAGPLPEEVPAAVKRWAKDWGTGALVEAVLLQAERPEVLDDLMADPLLRPFLRRVPGAPTLALVQASGREQVRAALVERGMVLQSELLR